MSEPTPNSDRIRRIDEFLERIQADSGDLRLRAEQSTSLLTVTVLDSGLVASNVEKFQAYLVDAIDAASEGSSISSLLIDLREVTYVDSSALGAIINLYQRATKRNLKLGVAVSPQAHSIFQVLKFDRLIPTSTNLEEIVERIKVK